MLAVTERIEPRDEKRETATHRSDLEEESPKETTEIGSRDLSHGRGAGRRAIAKGTFGLEESSTVRRITSRAELLTEHPRPHLKIIENDDRSPDLDATARSRLCTQALRILVILFLDFHHRLPDGEAPVQAEADVPQVDACVVHLLPASVVRHFRGHVGEFPIEV